MGVLDRLILRDDQWERMSENGGEKVDHGSGVIVSLRAAQR
ncbi:hypothetical protein [Aquamicrobium sp.]|nr:hypothetical protein [Aquamicrobium sp.]